MSFSDPDRARIAAAIAAAEANTSGEIVCIVDETRHRYPATTLTIAVLLAFALPLGAVVLGFDVTRLLPLRDWSGGDVTADIRSAIEAYAAVQVAIFTAVAALLHFTYWGAALTPHAIRRDRVHAAALAQFRARGLERTRDRTGVLIFVAMPDHVAEVIADSGIYARVAPEHWGNVIAALLAGIKADAHADGFVAAIGLAGAVLAEHFPPRADDSNELPDRLIEL